jgi:hypothetical protein
MTTEKKNKKIQGEESSIALDRRSFERQRGNLIRQTSVRLRIPN